MQAIDKMIEKAKIAQGKWERSSQGKIDIAVREIARTIHDNAEELSRLTVEETKLGTYEFNLSQDKRKSEIIWYSLKGKKSVGIINIDKEKGYKNMDKIHFKYGNKLKIKDLRFRLSSFYEHIKKIQI